MKSVFHRTFIYADISTPLNPAQLLNQSVHYTGVRADASYVHRKTSSVVTAYGTEIHIETTKISKVVLVMQCQSQ